MSNEEMQSRRVGPRAAQNGQPQTAPKPPALGREDAGLSAAAEERAAHTAAASAGPEIEDEDDAIPTLTRRSRRGAIGDVNFEVPESLKKPGWDYQWFVTRYAGMETEDAVFANAKEQGWRPVRPKDMPGYVSPDHSGNTVDRYGQRLYMRPMYLTAEARTEDYAIAEEQKNDKLKASSNVPVPDAKMRPTAPEMRVEYEMGHAKPRAA